MNLPLRHYINGQWLRGAGPPFFASNPATGKKLWEGYAAEKNTVDQAVAAARKAFPLWRALEFDERVRYVEAFSRVLLKAKTALAEVISQSTGKPLWESHSEVQAMANKAAISIEAWKNRCPTLQTSLPQGISLTSHHPHGVMAVLGPFNFPGHLPNGHLIPALLAGNTAVFKPSELAPLAAEATIRCWESAGIPPGVINLVQGGKETGKLLSGHPGIDGLLFTGSWPTGKRLAELMAQTPDKILALEMGGNNPLVIGTFTDIHAAAYVTVQSAYLTSGQRCTCARRLIVPKGVQGDQFLKILIEKIRGIQVGAYTETPEPFMGPVITAEAADHLLEAQKILIGKGASPLHALARMDKGAAFLTPGLLDVTQVKVLPDEELFGPLLQVIRTNSFEESLAEANRTRYGLASGLLSDKEEEFRLFFQSARAGVVNWNTPLTGASSSAPFGGTGQSGNNRPGAFYAADYCAYPVASMIAKELKKPDSLPLDSMDEEMEQKAHEVNFDGIVGPTHNYGGLSYGNRASEKNRFRTSNPREAALQGLEKMKFFADRGVKQAVLPRKNAHSCPC